MDENKKLTDEQLQNISGGGPELSSNVGKGQCYFTPDKSEYPMRKNGVCFIKCASVCRGCKCHGKEWCVDRWHQVYGGEELYPPSHANHKDKPKSNNYNT